MPRILHTVRTSVKNDHRKAAHYAADVGGIIRGMAAKNSHTISRGVRIPVDPAGWWVTAIRADADARAKDLGIRAPGIRDLTAELVRRGVDAGEDDVGRCLRGEIVTWEIARPLSEILGVPPPAQMPATLEEAEVIASLLKLRKLR